jgi:DNA-binding response OmpR family regulator
MVRIAIVDDNESWCFALEIALGQQGYDTAIFSDPWQFLQRADQFDVAIVDYSIPAPRYQLELDGISLIRQVKEQFARPPLLLLISSYFPNDESELLQSFCEEADLVLSRPRQIRELLHPVQKLLAQRSGYRSGSRSSVA